MKIKLPCVQCTTLGVCFTDFKSPVSIIDCVSSILKVGAGLDKSKKMMAAVEIMFHEKYGDLYIPRTYRFFFDMSVSSVVDYLEIEFDNLVVE